MNTAVCGFAASEKRIAEFASLLSLPTIATEWHRFPDGESGVRVLSEIPERVIVFAELDHPDEKFLPLIFLLDLLRELGAKRIELAAPYLPYMRQDMRFRDGEAITSRSFARALSGYCDSLVTIDPHLHRYDSLDEIYSVPGRVLNAAALIAAWISSNIEKPVLIGPDSESEQWVKNVADRAGAPFAVFEKTRRGDRDVDIRLRGENNWQGYAPVLVDDIISSGHTMAETVSQLRTIELPNAVCVGIHGLFADDALQLLKNAGASRIITTNTIPHETNAIDILPLLADSLR